MLVCIAAVYGLIVMNWIKSSICTILIIIVKGRLLKAWDILSLKPKKTVLIVKNHC